MSPGSTRALPFWFDLRFKLSLVRFTIFYLYFGPVVFIFALLSWCPLFYLYQICFVRFALHCITAICCLVALHYVGYWKTNTQKGKTYNEVGVKVLDVQSRIHPHNFTKKKCQHVCLFSATNIRRLRTHLLKDCNYMWHFNDSLHLPQCVCECLPESSILGCGPSRYNLGDEDWGVVSDVRVISPTCDTESQTWVTLHKHTDTVCFNGENKHSYWF